MEKILEKLKIGKTILGKSEKTSGSKYRIKFKYNNKEISFIYHDNIYNESETEDFIYALLLDSESFENSIDLDDFLKMFGYEEERKEGKRIYEACKKNHEKFNHLFNEEEIKILKKHFENY